MYYYWLKKVVQEKWHQTNDEKLPPKLEKKEKMNLSIKIPWSFVENAKKY
jgi:hypothetical protein